MTLPQQTNSPEEVALLKRQLEALNIVSHTLIDLTDLDKTLGVIVYELGKRLNYLNPVVYLLNEDNKSLSVRKVNVPEFVVKLTEKFVGRSIYSVRFNLSESNALTRAITQGEMQVSTTLKDVFSPYLTDIASQMVQTTLRMGAIITVPIKIETKTIGVLSLGSKSKNVLPGELQVISTFADQISIAIFNAQAAEKQQNQIAALKAQNRDLAALYNLATNVSKTLDPKIVAQSAVDAIPQDEFMAGAAIDIIDYEKKEIRVNAVSRSPLVEQIEKMIGDFSKIIVPLTPKDMKDESLVQRTARLGKSHFTNEIELYLRPAIPTGVAKAIAKLINVKSVVVYPIQVRGKMLGVISFFLRSKPFNELTPNQQRLLYTYTLQIGIAMENAELFTHGQIIQANLQKALIQLQEARRQERDMLDVMAHELRTPISIVRNSLAMIERIAEKNNGTVEPKTLQRYLAMSTESTKREINLIETLMSATKVEASRLQLVYTKVDVKDAIQDAIEAQQIALMQKGLDLVYNVPKEDVFAYSDRTRIQEVVDNFISNAIKYTAEGKIVIDIWREKDNIWIKISDSGIGIDPKDLPNLGKKFFRAKQYIGSNTDYDRAKVIRPGGTGLGLYVAFALVRLLKGKLFVTSDIGKGTSFTFSVPLFVGQADASLDQTFDPTKASTLERDHIFFNDPKTPRLPE